MDHAEHADQNVRSLALRATLHCLTGCGIGEIVGMVISTAVGLSDVASIVLSVVLAFAFGFGLTLGPMLAGGAAFVQAARLTVASDLISITTMEIIDNAIVLVIPGAMSAGLGDGLFWGSLAFSLIVAFVVTFPVNGWLISRGRGHALVHSAYSGHNH